MAIQLKHIHTCTFSPLHSRTRTKLSTPFTLQVKASTSPPPRPTTTTTTTTNVKKLIQSGKIRAIPPKDAAMALTSEGYNLLDIRPQWERQRASVVGSLHVPFFIEDPDTSPVTLLKKWVHFGYIGLWTGQSFTMFNPGFLQEVAVIVPDKNTKLLVACGEGLRSMMAASKLYGAGYKNLGWLAGGFIRSSDTDFPAVEGLEKLQYATIGGASYYFLKLILLLQSVGGEKD